MTSLQTLKVNYAGEELEVAFAEHDGEKWLIANPFAEILGYKDMRKSIYNFVSEFNKTEADQFDLPGTSIQPRTKFINIAGLYELIQRSKMPKAREFQQWVNSNLLQQLNTQHLDNFAEYKRENSTDELDTSGWFYIATTSKLREHGCIKIGKTRNLKKRLCSYNCGRFEDEFMEYEYTVRIDNNIDSFESKIKNLCINYIHRGEILKCNIEHVIYVVETCLNK